MPSRARIGPARHPFGGVVFRLADPTPFGQCGDVHTQIEACQRAVGARDPRFDGWFFVGVSTTGIYCRPSCPAIQRPIDLAKAVNMTFHPSAAAAQQAGYRACKRCRPDASPGSPQWDVRADVVARAMRLIADGVLDRHGVPGLAAQLGYSVRQLERLIRAEVGAGPLAIARANRAQTARLLIETTDLAMIDVSAAAGFNSVRAFNTCVGEVFATSPTQLRRAAAGRKVVAAPGVVDVRLAFRPPLCPDNLFGHLIATAVPGVEEWHEGSYRRTLRLPHGTGIIALRPPPDSSDDRSRAGHITACLRLADLRDLPVAIARCRRLLDLDADPTAIDTVLRLDPVLAGEVLRAPGRRVPRTVDGAEFAVRAVLGQQISTAAARTQAARLVLAHGEPITDPDGGLTHLFPTAVALAEVVPETLAMPRSRRATLVGLLDALCLGELDLGPGADPPAARACLSSLPGIGPWTTEMIAMRSLGDPDAFPATDLGIRRAASALGLPGTQAELIHRSRVWAPWRSYAVQYLWATGVHAVNQIPVAKAI
jgi:AraC family transcriptional regulator of adaptative response / DNA-3-methyladenine glycosylase II